MIHHRFIPLAITPLVALLAGPGLACGSSSKLCADDGTFTLRVAQNDAIYVEAGTAEGQNVAPGDAVTERLAPDSQGYLPVGGTVTWACVGWSEQVPPDNDGTVHRAVVSPVVEGRAFDYLDWDGSTKEQPNKSRARPVALWISYAVAAAPDGTWATATPTAMPGGAGVELEFFSAFYSGTKWRSAIAEDGATLTKVVTGQSLDFDRLDFVVQGISGGSGLKIEHRIALEAGTFDPQGDP